MHRVHLLTAFTLFVAALSGCREPACRSNADCPSYAYCDVGVGECFTPPDGGTEFDAGVPGFSISLDPAAVTIEQGQSATVQVNFVRDAAFTGTVELSLVSPPNGVSATPVNVGPSDASGSLTVSLSPDAPVGIVQLTVAGKSGSLESAAALELTIQEAPMLVVDFASPTGEVFTNGTVSFQVVVTGGTPDSVELTKDGEVLATLQPPYSYAWDTTVVSEGTYAITARALRLGASFTSSARNVTVDRTAPAVVSQSPASGAKASVQAPITVQFNEPILATSMTDSAVTLSQDTTAKPKTLSLLPDGVTISISPSATPTTPTTYSVNVTGVTDRAGNTATTMWSWTYPTWLQLGSALSAVPGSTPSEAPSLKLDPAGVPVVAWSESDGSTKNIYVAKWTGTAWQLFGGALSAVTGAGTHATNPDLALDSAGNPVVAWIELATSGSNAVHVAQWTGAAWMMVGSGLINASTSAPAAGPPDVEVTSNGYPIVAWDEFGPSRSVYVSRWTGTSWQAFPSPSSTCATAECGEPSLALSGGLDPVVAFTENWADSSTGQGGRRVRVARWNSSGFPSAWILYGTGLSMTDQLVSSGPALRVSSTGVAAVVWTANNGMTFGKSLRLATWDGTGWTNLPSPHTVAFNDPGVAALALDGANAPFVSWTSSNGNLGSGSNIRAARWSNGAWTQLGGPPTSGTNVSASSPSVEVQPDGRASIAFRHTSSSIVDALVAVENR